MPHKAGFVNILGAPNVGKSTLMNAITGEKLSIVTPKAQTTRHRIIGIVNGDDYQIVFSDTPGVITPQYKLQESMMGFVQTAMEDADIFLLVVEHGEPIEKSLLLPRLLETQTPVIIALNKIDLADQTSIEKEIDSWKQRIPHADILPISALHNFNIDGLLKILLQYLPESPPYFDKDELTDRNLRFFVSEIIREKILLNFKQEIPYSAEVAIEDFQEDPTIVRIRASIIVNRESQKIIVIGHHGKAIKRLGTDARKDIEVYLGQKVFLELTVKVIKDWRDDPRHLRWFGYNPQ